MKLQRCKKCKKEVSKKADKCTHCGIKNPTVTIKEILGLIGIMVFSLIFFNWVNDESKKYDTPVSPDTETRIQNLDNYIANYAIDTITPAQYPNTYKTWGQEKVDWLNSLQRPAAKYILNKYTCDYVESVSISPSKSQPPNFVIFNIDCKNGNRYLASNLDLE